MFFYNDYNKKISNIIITCQDTGRGIKPELINKLFTKFERLDIEKNTTTEGTGLGLAITKSLVEMMGGKINVRSQYGQGSIFMIQIPQKISRIQRPATEQELIDTAVASKQFIGNEKEITDAINNYLSTVPQFEGFYSVPLENELDKVDALLGQETFSKTKYLGLYRLKNSA